MKEVQQSIETVIGGVPLTMTVEGRERYSIRVRVARELRDRPEDLHLVFEELSNSVDPSGALLTAVAAGRRTCGEQRERCKRDEVCAANKACFLDEDEGDAASPKKGKCPKVSCQSEYFFEALDCI